MLEQEALLVMLILRNEFDLPIPHVIHGLIDHVNATRTNSSLESSLSHVSPLL